MFAIVKAPSSSILREVFVSHYLFCFFRSFLSEFKKKLQTKCEPSNLEAFPRRLAANDDFLGDLALWKRNFKLIWM